MQKTNMEIIQTTRITVKDAMKFYRAASAVEYLQGKIANKPESIFFRQWRFAGKAAEKHLRNVSKRLVEKEAGSVMKIVAFVAEKEQAAFNCSVPRSTLEIANKLANRNGDVTFRQLDVGARIYIDITDVKAQKKLMFATGKTLDEAIPIVNDFDAHLAKLNELKTELAFQISRAISIQVANAKNIFLTEKD